MSTESTKRALVHSETDVAHELGYVGDWLAARGYQVERVYRDHSGNPISFPDADILINLGSLSSVADGYTLDPALAEIAAVNEWINSGRPYIGICFGAQVLARVFGGQVERQPSTHREILTVDSGDNELGPWVRWHEDFITAVGSAQVVSKSDNAIMLFNEGCAWGIQPHLELTPDTLNRMAETVKTKPEHYQGLVHDLAAGQDSARASTFALLDEIAGA